MSEDSRWLVVGMGGYGVYDDYDEAREFAEREACRASLDPVVDDPQVPIYTVTDTEYVGDDGS